MTLAELIAQKLEEALAKWIKDSKDELTDIAKAGGKEAGGGLLGDVHSLFDIFTGLLSEIPLFGEIADIALKPVKDVADGGGKLGSAFGLGYLSAYMAYQLAAPILLPLEHEINHLTENEIFDPQTAAQLAAKRIITSNHGASEASGGGIDGEHFAQMLEGQYVRPALAELLALWRRQAINDGQVAGALVREGVRDEWIEPLMSLKRILLSPADLALAELRGEITTETANGYAEQLGITRDDFQVLIGNTGEPLGLMQLLEAYRRGFIDKDRLERGIRQSRVRNEWIDTAEQLRFAPMSIANAIDAAVQGHLDLDTAKQKTEQNGLLPEDFQAVFETAGQPISREEALELMHRGLFTQDQVISAIRESHVKNKYIPAILELGRRLIPYRTINTIISHGVKDHAWGVDYLLSLGYSRDDAEALIATSQKQKTATTKHLATAQIQELYESQAIDAGEAEQLLKDQGYTETEARELLAVLESRIAIAERNRAITAVRAAYLNARVSKQEASTDLDKLGVFAKHRDALIAEWEIERKVQVKTLTPAQYATAAKLGLIRFEEAHSKLVALGYSNVDATLFLEIHKAIPPGTTVAPTP